MSAEMSSDSPLASASGSYPGCIAEAALNFGETEGDVVELTRTLEQIAEACAHASGEGDACLLGPVAAHLGLVSVASRSDQWWLYPEEDRITYPEVVMGTKVRDYMRTADCLDYREVKIPVSVGDAGSVIDGIDDRFITALVYVQAHGDPGRSSDLKMFGSESPAKDVLIGLSKVVLASTADGELGGRASMHIEEDAVTLADEIDGLIIHGNYHPPTFGGPELPQDRIVLPWPRSRTEVVNLTAEQIAAFTNRV